MTAQPRTAIGLVVGSLSDKEIAALVEAVREELRLPKITQQGLANLDPRSSAEWHARYQELRPATLQRIIVNLTHLDVILVSRSAADAPSTPGLNRGGFVTAFVLVQILGIGFGLSMREEHHFRMTQVALAGVMLCLVRPRLVNLGFNPWWTFGALVPLVNLWVLLVCLFAPAGYRHSKKLDKAGLYSLVGVVGLFVLALTLVIWGFS